MNWNMIIVKIISLILSIFLKNIISSWFMIYNNRNQLLKYFPLLSINLFAKLSYINDFLLLKGQWNKMIHRFKKNDVSLLFGKTWFSSKYCFILLYLRAFEVKWYGFIWKEEKRILYDITHMYIFNQLKFL